MGFWRKPGKWNCRLKIFFLPTYHFLPGDHSLLSFSKSLTSASENFCLLMGFKSGWPAFTHAVYQKEAMVKIACFIRRSTMPSIFASYAFENAVEYCLMITPLRSSNEYFWSSENCLVSSLSIDKTLSLAFALSKTLAQIYSLGFYVLGLAHKKSKYFSANNSGTLLSQKACMPFWLVYCPLWLVLACKGTCASAI